MFRTAAFTAVGLCLLALPIQSRAASGPIHIPALARVTRSQLDAHCRREHPRNHGQGHRRSLRAGVSREFNREGKSQTQMCTRNNPCTQSEQQLIITPPLPGIDGNLKDPTHLRGTKTDMIQ